MEKFLYAKIVQYENTELIYASQAEHVNQNFYAASTLVWDFHKTFPGRNVRR